MSKIYLITLSIFFSLIISAPVNRNGTTSMNFLEIDIGGAGSSLGGAYVSVADDATACFWNPAGLTGSQKNNLVFVYEPWLLDMEHYFIATASKVGSFGHIGLSLNYMNYGDEEVTTVTFPDGTGEFYSSNEYSLSISYAKRIVDWFSFGSSLKYLSSNIWHLNASAAAIDLGVLINTKFFAKGGDRNTGMRIGMSISNFGNQVKYDGIDLLNSIDISEDYGNFENVPGQYKMSSWELPLIFRIGASITPIHNSSRKLLVSTDMLHPNNNAESLNFGIEYTERFRNISEIYLRLGSKWISNVEVESSEDIKLYELEDTYGLGLKIKMKDFNALKVDYCYKKLGILGRIHLYTIGIEF